MTPRKPGDYPVGYGKPPEATRFKKGHSGNPAGRAKGRSSVAAVLRHAVTARVVVTERGRRTRKSKLVIMLTQLANKAAAGDLKAVALLIPLLSLLDPAGTSALGLPDFAADRATAERVLARWAAAAGADTPSPATPEASHALDE